MNAFSRARFKYRQRTTRIDEACKKIRPSPLDGLFQEGLEARKEDRDFLARSPYDRECAAHCLETADVLASLSMINRRTTICGLHLQKRSAVEVKATRCLSGTVFDFTVDLRPESITRAKWIAAELSAENGCCLYITPGFAHGFQPLTPNALHYQLVSTFHEPSSEVGLRYDDPKIGVRWALIAAELSSKDASWPPLDSIAFTLN